MEEKHITKSIAILIAISQGFFHIPIITYHPSNRKVTGLFPAEITMESHGEDGWVRDVPSQTFQVLVNQLLLITSQSCDNEFLMFFLVFGAFHVPLKCL